MQHILVRKLELFTRLSTADKHQLQHVTSERVRLAPARLDIVREGDKPTHVLAVLEGWACRYKMLEDGRRQIIAFLLPGDICDLNVFILREMDHSIAAITPLRYAELNREALESLTDEPPPHSSALWWETLVVNAIQREWSVNLGQRSAFENSQAFAYLSDHVWSGRLRWQGHHCRVSEDHGRRLNYRNSW